MNNFAKLSQEFGHHLVYLTSQLFFYSEQPHSLSEMERKMRAMLLRVGQFLMGSWLAVQETSHLDETVACPYCGGQTIYRFKQDDSILTTLGQVGYSRAYFVCLDCQQGHYPLDQKLGLRPGQMSDELERLSGMAGAQLPFEQGSRLFEALTLVSMSDRCLAEATRAMGQEVQALESEWLIQSQDTNWLQEQRWRAERPKCLYGLIQEAKVSIRGENGRPWPDFKVGAWFATTANPPRSPADAWDIQPSNISFYCDALEAKQFGELLWATGCQRHAELAQTLIFVGNGSAWSWELVQENYPEAIQIVDWFHAIETIGAVANVAFDDKESEQSWVEDVRAGLWNGQVDAVIAALDRLTERPRAAEAATNAVTYFATNRYRMNYPDYRANGYQISSRAIDDACKQIISQWLRVTGAIWDQTYAIKTAKAYAALLSDQWKLITSRR